MTTPEEPVQPPQFGNPEYGAPQPYSSSFGQPPPSYGQPPPYGYSQPAYGYGAPAGYGPPLGTSQGCIASMGNRLLARIIDGLLIGGVALAIMIPLGVGVIDNTNTVNNPDGTTTTTINHGFFGALVATIAVFAVIGILYEVAFIAVRGATLGKMAAGVRVVRSDNGQVPGWGSSFVRWIIPTVANFVCGLLTLLVYISPFFDNTHRNQGWHDKAASTFVIRAR